MLSMNINSNDLRLQWSRIHPRNIIISTHPSGYKNNKMKTYILLSTFVLIVEPASNNY